MSIIDFQTDVSDPGNIEAESLVHQYLTSVGFPVIDCRPENGSWDFKFSANGKWWTLDVKHDTNIARTQNFPFEVCDLRPDMSLRPTWGINPELDYLAVVTEHLDTAYVAYLGKMRTIAVPRFRRYWRSWATPNPSDGKRVEWVTFGFAIPLADLKKNGVSVATWDLTRLENAS